MISSSAVKHGSISGLPINHDAGSHRNEAANSLAQKVKNIFIACLHLLTLPISSFVTEGIAHLKGVQILRHGTSVPNYFGILVNGADPNRGGSKSGSSQLTLDVFDKTKIIERGDEAIQRCKRYFFVFKDSFEDVLKGKPELSFKANLLKRIFPRVHAFLSGSSVLDPGIKGHGPLSLTIKIISGLFFGLFVPTLRFAYGKEETKAYKFEEDPDYQQLALKTPCALSNRRIGLLGALSAPMDPSAKTLTAKEKLAAVAKITAGVGLTLVGLGLIF